MKKLTRHNLNRNSETCQEKTPKKPSLSSNKTQIEFSNNILLLNVPHQEKSYRQYLEIKSGKESERALYKHHCYDQIKALTPKGQEVIAYLFMLHKKHRVVNPTQGTIATEVGCSIQTVGRALKDAKARGILDWDTGRWERRANVYKFSSYFYASIGKKYALNAIGHLVKMLSQSQCRTYIEYNARKHKLTISELVNQSSRTGEGRSPEPVSSPKSEAIHFSRRERGKVRVSNRDGSLFTHQKSIHTHGNQKRAVYSRKSMPSSHKNAKLNKKGAVMSNDALKVLADIENENMYKKQRSDRHGPKRICGPEYQDLKRSIAYHFSGNYIHQKEDRIFDKATTTFLRKKYGL